VGVVADDDLRILSSMETASPSFFASAGALGQFRRWADIIRFSPRTRVSLPSCLQYTQLASNLFVRCIFSPRSKYFHSDELERNWLRSSGDPAAATAAATEMCSWSRTSWLVVWPGRGDESMARSGSRSGRVGRRAQPLPSRSFPLMDGTTILASL
jgi:hypothetical protein